MPITFTAQQRQDLLNALVPGRANALSAPVLEQILGYPPTRNQTKLRKLIKECIEHDNDLIGSITGSPAGYFMISSIAELDNYLDSLEGRIRSDNTRRDALILQWNGANPAVTTTRLPLIIT